jgi:EmrB/QacA subfamily drug resistance transporter
VPKNPAAALAGPVNSASSARAVRDNRWLILVVVSIAQLMVVLDATVVNIALPSAQADIGFADGQRQWIVTAYALAFGSLLLLGGRIGDLFGRKWTFIGGLAGFAVASAIGGAAGSFGVLVAARALQGVAGAILAPAALSTLVTTFRDPRDRGKAFGVFGSVAVGGGAVGLILGGVLTEYLSWRWAMYVNVVFAVGAGVGALIYMVNERPAVRPRIDFVGALLASAGLFGLVFGFSHAESTSWTNVVTLLSLVLGVALLAIFGLAEQRIRVPLLPLRVIADRSRAVAYVSVCIAGVAMFGVFLFLTFYLQLVKGFSPVTCGLAFLPMVACIMISSNISSMVTLPRFGPRVVITVGMLLGAVALGDLSRLHVGSNYAGGVLPALMIMGLAMGMIMAPSMNTATAGVLPQDAGVASALVSTMQQVGGSIGTSALSTIAASVTANYLVDHHTNPLAAQVAATHGYVTAFGIGSGLFLVGAVMGVTLFPSKARLQEMRAAAETAPAGSVGSEQVDDVLAEVLAVEV